MGCEVKKWYQGERIWRSKEDFVRKEWIKKENRKKELREELPCGGAYLDILKSINPNLVDNKW